MRTAQFMLDEVLAGINLLDDFSISCAVLKRSEPDRGSCFYGFFVNKESLLCLLSLLESLTSLSVPQQLKCHPQTKG